MNYCNSITSIELLKATKYLQAGGGRLQPGGQLLPLSRVSRGRLRGPPHGEQARVRLPLVRALQGGGAPGAGQHQPEGGVAGALAQGGGVQGNHLRGGAGAGQAG